MTCIGLQNSEHGARHERGSYRSSHKIGAICLSILARHKLWTMRHMGQVCLRFLLCKKATIPLTNPYDPVAARFYIVLYIYIPQVAILASVRIVHNWILYIIVCDTHMRFVLVPE